jgi:hypothetical protein
VVIADASGSAWLFAADKGGTHLRRWKPGDMSPIPVGKPSSGVAAQSAGPMGSVAVYTVDGKAAVAIDPERDVALWTAHTGDDITNTLVGAPQPAGENRWVITDLSGRVLVLDGSTGKPLARLSIGLPGAVPSAASAVAGGTALTLLSDGSAVVGELPKLAPPPPPPLKMPLEEPKKE